MSDKEKLVSEPVSEEQKETDQTSWTGFKDTSEGEDLNAGTDIGLSGNDDYDSEFISNSTIPIGDATINMALNDDLPNVDVIENEDAELKPLPGELELDDTEDDDFDLEAAIISALPAEEASPAVDPLEDDLEGFYMGEPEENTDSEEYVASPKKKRDKSARPLAMAAAAPLAGAQADVSAQNGDAANAAGEDAPKPKKKHKFLKCAGIFVCMLGVAAGTAYAGVSYYFTDKFFDGTTINGMDVSRLTADQVENIIKRRIDEYSIQVSSREQEPQVISGDAINYRYQSEGEVLAHLKEQKPYEWILGYIEPKTFSVKETVTYDKNLLKTEIQNLECAKAENQVRPEDAYVMYEDNNFSIIPETEGTTLNIKQAYLALEAAVSEGESAVDFNASPEAYEEAKVKQDDPGLQSTLDACNNFAKASITYDMGRESVTLDGSTIKDWLLFDDNNQLIQDQKVFEDHIGAFVDELKKKYDTVGTDRELIATTGRLVTVHGNYYGWSIDRAAEVAQLAADIRNGEVTTREPIYARRGHERNERNDFGDTYIEVDLAYQHMYYYSDGEIIFESDIVSGNPNLEGRATPPGIFSLDFKKTDEILRGQQDEEGKYEYETHVDYWMPFNGGVGFHDAPWQPWFGGDLFLWNGSHGCINLPPEAAARLYNIIDYGIPIIVFN